MYNARCAETLVEKKRVPQRPQQVMQGPLATAWDGLQDSLSVLTRNSLFFKLALTMAASGVVFESLQDLLFNYLMLTLNFTAASNAIVMVLLGICGLLVQV
jgi:hypothetical protein